MVLCALLIGENYAMGARTGETWPKVNGRRGCGGGICECRRSAVIKQAEQLRAPAGTCHTFWGPAAAWPSRAMTPRRGQLSSSLAPVVGCRAGPRIVLI
jgi:hypothetical protein